MKWYHYLLILALAGVGYLVGRYYGPLACHMCLCKYGIDPTYAEFWFRWAAVALGAFAVIAAAIAVPLWGIWLKNK